jgi:hypothetical protein
MEGTLTLGLGAAHERCGVELRANRAMSHRGQGR